MGSGVAGKGVAGKGEGGRQVFLLFQLKRLGLCKQDEEEAKAPEISIQTTGS